MNRGVFCRACCLRKISLRKSPVQNYFQLRCIQSSDKSRSTTYFQPITTSNLGPKIQQHEFSCLLAKAARDSPNGLRLDNASSGLQLAQLIQSVVRRLIPLPPSSLINGFACLVALFAFHVLRVPVSAKYANTRNVFLLVIILKKYQKSRAFKSCYAL